MVCFIREDLDDDLVAKYLIQIDEHENIYILHTMLLAISVIASVNASVSK